MALLHPIMHLMVLRLQSLFHKRFLVEKVLMVLMVAVQIMLALPVEKVEMEVLAEKVQKKI